jgi:hypothetical protein
MNRVSYLIVALTVALVGAPIAARQPGRKAPSLQGVWKIVEVTRPNGDVNRSPQPGIFIFTKDYFSAVQVTASAPRLPNPNPKTPDDFSALYGNEAFGASSGTYEYSAGVLKTRAIVAKNPEMMLPDNVVTRSVKFSGGGNMLSLTTTTTTREGAVRNRNMLQLQRVE